MNVTPLSDTPRLMAVSADAKPDGERSERSFLSALRLVPDGDDQPKLKKRDDPEEPAIPPAPAQVSGDESDTAAATPSGFVIQDAGVENIHPRPKTSELEKTAVDSDATGLVSTRSAIAVANTGQVAALRESSPEPAAAETSKACFPLVGEGQVTLAEAEFREPAPGVEPDRRQQVPAAQPPDLESNAGGAEPTSAPSTNVPEAAPSEAKPEPSGPRPDERNASPAPATGEETGRDFRVATNYSVSEGSPGEAGQAADRSGRPTAAALDAPSLAARQDAGHLTHVSPATETVRVTDFPSYGYEASVRATVNSAERSSAQATGGQPEIPAGRSSGTASIDTVAGDPKFPLAGAAASFAAADADTNTEVMGRARPLAEPMVTPARAETMDATQTIQTVELAPSALEDFGPDGLASGLQSFSDAAPGARLERSATPVSVSHELPRLIGHQIVDAVSRSPERTIEIALSPEELGRVRLSLTPGDGSMTLVLHADRPETLDLLRRNIESLAQDFRDLGFHDLSFSFGHGTGQDRATPQETVETDDAPATNRNAPISDSPVARQRPGAATTAGLDLRF